MKNFSIFKNNYKEKDTQPDYVMSFYDKESGSTKLGGVWLKETQKGDKYFSCSLGSEYEIVKKEVQPEQ